VWLSVCVWGGGGSYFPHPKETDGERKDCDSSVFLSWRELTSASVATCNICAFVQLFIFISQLF
jgi:hypothetical protein